MDIFNLFVNRSKYFILAVGVLLLIAVAAIDYYIGKDVNLKILYLVPLSLTTWYVGVRSGLNLTLFSSVLEIIIKIEHGVEHTYFSFFYLDGLISFGIFASYVIILWKLRAAMDEIKISNEALKKSNEIKNEFIELAVHDLKNPLSNVIGLSGIINEENLGREEIKELSKRIYSSSERMIKVVNNLLMNREIELDKLRVNIEPFDLIPIIEDIIDQNKSAAAAKQILVNFNSSNKSLIIYADINLTSQVFDNLLSNAIKFSPNGKNVWVHVKRLSPEETLNNGLNVKIEVSDEGPGITEEDKQKLFSRFAKLSAKPTGNEHSTGIGLFLVKKFVEAMNGKVWCESEINKGAKFIVELTEGKNVN